MPVVTFLTDFGARDYYVGAMKGALLSVNPRVNVVDITHNIPAHDVGEAAYTLLAASETFPLGTIHVAVVDPGVGSERRAIAGECAGRLYVGPDNGLFGYVFERAGAARVFRLTNADYFRSPVSPTFHGRDIFAPVAGALSLGVEPAELGESITDWARLAPLTPARAPDGSLDAEIIHIDRFGNCVTNVTRRELPDARLEGGFSLAVGGRTVRRFRRFFAEAASDGDGAGEPFALWSSAGFLEIAAYRESAAGLLGVRRGQKVKIVKGES